MLSSTLFMSGQVHWPLICWQPYANHFHSNTTTTMTTTTTITTTTAAATAAAMPFRTF